MANGEKVKTKIILVVEDHPTNLKISVEILKMDGWQVHQAATGEEAIEILDTIVPHIVLLDIGLPDIDGFEIFKMIRQNEAFKAVKVVSFTGMGNPHYREEVQSYSFDGYISKPMDITQFLKTLNDLLPGSN